MNSFELNILTEQERAGSDFMSRVVNEIRRAFALEKSSRKITQQAVAEKIGTSRAVVNRQIQGLENLSARRIGELLWAIGWEPHFEARKIPVRENIFIRKMDDVALQKAPAKPFQQLTKIGSNVEIHEIRTN